MFSQRKRRSSPDDESEDIFGNGYSQSSQLSRRKQKKTNSSSDLFKTLISDAGFILNDGIKPNELSCDQAIFQKELKRLFRHHELCSSDKVVNKFIENLEKYIEDKSNLKWTLLYTKTVANCSSARGNQQDSLIRLLLNIDSVQPLLIKLLTETLLLIAHDDDSSDRVEISLLILANLRWLDHIVDCSVLTEKIVDLLHGSPLQIQREVINVVPDIIDDANHSIIAKNLCEIFESTEELVPSVIETLPYLTLKPESLVEVHHSVLKRIETTEMEHLPLVIKFLLHNTSEKMIYNVVNDIRKGIVITSDTASSPSKSQRKKILSSQKLSSAKNQLIDYKLLLFSNIEMSVLVKKFIPNIWLKTIDDNTESSSFYPFDMLVLFVFYGAVPTCRKDIKKLFRDKIRKGLFTNALLMTTFKEHISIIKKYYETVKSLASVFIRSSSTSVGHYGAAIYRYAFIYLDGYDQQGIVLSLLHHLGDNDYIKTMVLSLISELAHDHTKPMLKYTNFLRGSLDLLEYFDLRDAKKLMDVICLLAFSPSDTSGLRDELSILMRKQLSNPDMMYKRLGVLSAVQAVKNMLLDEESLDETSRVIEECRSLFYLVVQTTSSSYTATALFMDELASTILKEGVNQNFEKIINEKVTQDFIDCFLTDYESDSPPPPSCNGHAMELRWSLEESPTVYLNLGPKLITAEESRTDIDNFQNIVLILGPQFRLMRMIESRLNEGDLGNIDALLGCPVYFPSESLVDKFSSLSQKEQHIILSCYFYTVNWFRELINAFATQRDSLVKKKVFSRLRQLIQLQNKLSELLPQCPSYEPHLANFDMTNTGISNPLNSALNKKKDKTSRKGKGKLTSKKKDKDQTTTQISSQSQAAVSQTQKQDNVNDDGLETVDLASYTAYLRELHFDVFNLLFKNLELDVNSEAQNHISLLEIEFLLNDFNSKLSHAFETQNRNSFGTSKKDHGFSNLDLFSSSEIAEYTYFFLKPVCVHLEKISGLYQELIESNDGIMDAPALFTKDLIPVSSVYTALFTTIATMLSWPDLQLEQNEETKKNILIVIAKRIDKDAGTLKDEELLTSTFRYMSNFGDSILNLKTTSMLVKVLEALCNLDDTGSLKESLCEIVEGFMKRIWYNLEGREDSGALFNKRLGKLLKVYISYSGDKLDKINTIVSEPMIEFVHDKDKRDASEMYATLNKGTLDVFYSNLLESLVPAINKSLSQAVDTADKLAVWENSISIYEKLANLLNIYDRRTLLMPYMSYSRGFIELFLHKAMPLLDKQLLQDHHLVLSLFKKLQKSTRKLHYICTHSKAKKDASMMRHVPVMKKILETLIFRVKAMLVKNDCSHAFWMGNLKNRDLKGKEISNDISRIEDEESDETSVSAPTNESDDEQEEIEASDDDKEEESEISGSDSEEDNSKSDGAVTEFSRSF